MNPAQLELIRRTWAALAPHADGASAEFYARFLALAPDAAPLFAATDMAAQRRKFMDTLAALVRVAEDPGALVSESVPHGRRHAHYGATDAHFAAAGAALLQTLEHALGPRFTPEAREAWAELYALVSAVMRRAGERALRPVRAGATPVHRAR